MLFYARGALLKIRNLDTFYWIANLGGFRAAAEHLNITQPAISARIQNLEQDLGVSLFVRQARTIELTEAGRKLLPQAEKLMALDQTIIQSFSSSITFEQTIRLGSSETIVCSWLPDFLMEFNRTHTHLNFELIVDSTNKLRDALVAREIDLAFLMGPVSDASVENQELCGFEMIFAAAPDIANQHVSWTKQDLARQLILTFTSNTKPHRQIRQLLAPYTQSNVRINSSASLGALTRLAVSGYGVCAMPKAIISNELQDGSLVQLASDVELPAIQFTLSYGADSAVQLLVHEIANEVTAFLRPKLIKNIYRN